MDELTGYLKRLDSGLVVLFPADLYVVAGRLKKGRYQRLEMRHGDQENVAKRQAVQQATCSSQRSGGWLCPRT